MAKNTGNKRTAVRHVRDGIKSNYVKDTKCACCGTEEDLELHHYTTVSKLLSKYCKENNIPIRTDEEVLAMREDFYTAHWHELVEYTVTLCNKHHMLLHKIFGKDPDLHTASKQEKWVEKFHGKMMGKDATTTIQESDSRFGSLVPKGTTGRFSDLI